MYGGGVDGEQALGVAAVEQGHNVFGGYELQAVAVAAGGQEGRRQGGEEAHVT